MGGGAALDGVALSTHQNRRYCHSENGTSSILD